MDDWEGTAWAGERTDPGNLGLKSLDSLADRLWESIGPQSYHGFPRVPWDIAIDTHRDSTVTPSTALKNPIVWAAVRALSEDIAKLPWIVYRRTALPGGLSGKERATDHPWYETLHDFANPDMSAFTWRETMVQHLLLWGNCYSEIVYDRAGRPQLWPIRPDRMEVHWDAKGRKAFRYVHPTEGRQALDPERVFHVPGLGHDGLRGYSVISMHRLSVGEWDSARTAVRAFYDRGMTTKVWFETPTTWRDETRDKFREALESTHEGAKNAGRTGMLPPGVKPHVISMPLDDAQYVETRLLHVSDGSRIFRMPPDKLGDLTHATYSNIDQQDLNYAKYSIAPWTGRIESAAKQQFFREEPEIFSEFLLDDLLQGDPLARAQKLQIEMRNGAITPDEWRAAENRNPHPDGIGSRPFFAADLVPSAEPVAETEESEVGGEPVRLTVVKAARAFLTAQAAETNARIESDISAIRETERKHVEHVHANGTS